MIEHYFRPQTPEQALELMHAHSPHAVWFNGGSKLNAAPTRTDKTVAIALSDLPCTDIRCEGEALYLGAMCKLQALIEHELTPAALKEAAGFVYSRHIRHQATLGGEIAAKQDEAVLLPALLAMHAELILADGQQVSLEAYLDNPGALILEVVLPQRTIHCHTRSVRRSAGGLAVITAAVSLSADGNVEMLLDGMNQLGECQARPVSLRDVAGQALEGEALERAVAEAISPVADIRGSIEYKRYIAGVVMADLLVECQQLAQSTQGE